MSEWAGAGANPPMSFDTLVRRRRMIRAYRDDRGVPAAIRDQLIMAALRAPTAGFTQGISLLVVESEPDRTLFWSVTSEPNADNGWLRGMRSAPLLIMLWTSEDSYLERYALPDKGWVDRDRNRWSAPFWYVDAGMAAMSILLGAVDHGLGACFFGAPADRLDRLRAVFGVPEGQLLAGVISLGYPAAVPGSRGSTVRRARRPSSELVHLGRWTESTKE